VTERTKHGRVLLAALLFWACTGVGRAQELEGAAPAPLPEGSGQQALSRRNANYQIDVRLDTATRMLHGTQTLTWTNLQQKATNRLFFHLYWNAWRNRHSTWMREDRLRERSSRKGEIAAEDWGWVEVDSVGLSDDGTDLTRTMYFAFPDDRNIEDRTVMVVLLPQEVGPGETVRLDMTWRAKVPRTFARTGFRGDFYFIAQWFPKLGVYEGNGWNCHQFHAGTEFYSDYGVYDVSMTVPEGWVLGATGLETESRSNGDGTTTHRYQQADVHAFTWTTSPDYLVVEDRFESEALPAVDIRLLLQPEHAAQAERHLAATKVALDRYGRWYGAYPYGHVTVVDPAYGSGAGGMEYPTLFTAGTRRFNPPGGGNPEGVTIHEAGHQFWYGMVGNNEFEHAWLDEGINTFSTARAEFDAFGEGLHTERFFQPPGLEDSGFFPLLLAGFDYGGRPYLDRLTRYRPDATIAPQGVASFRYHPGKGGSLSYSKTALWLRTLENRLGWESLQGILSTFFERWKFRHPRAKDFFDVANEMTEEDISGFLRTVMGSADFDYAVESVATFPVRNEGWVDEGEELVYVDGKRPVAEGEIELFRSEVGVRRFGNGVFPVEVLFVFEDGKELRRKWDGEKRWELFVEEYPARLDYAVVDPDGVLALDLLPSNNSREVEPQAELPAWKWAARWTVWFEDFLSTFGFFV
jgi:hypothetical protein